MEITAGMVRDLREKTGLPMMECKKALTEAKGNIDEAIEWLKKNASAKLSKMASRETSQGRIAMYVDGDKAGLVRLLCETAPVSNTDDFIKLAGAMAKAAAQATEPTPESILACPLVDDPSKTIDQLKEDAFSRIRENMQLANVAALHGHVAGYVHHNAQVGVIVEFSDECPAELAGDVCMHIAALNPPYLRREDVPEAEIAEERERAKAEAAGKPEQIIEKIVTGKLDRWFSEVTLLEQPFVKDDKQSVTQALSAAKSGLTITRFCRLQVSAS